MAKYILTTTGGPGENNAGSKAGSDAERIACRYGYEPVMLFSSGKGASRIQKLKQLWDGVSAMKKFSRRLCDGDVVLLQYPLNRVLLKKICRILRHVPAKVSLVMLIHDIDYFRDIPLRKKGVAGMKQLELSLLGRADYLIAHNTSMIAALQKEALPVEYVSLELFDYLYEGKPAKISEHQNEVVVAGNLTEAKAGYLYDIRNDKHQFSLSLYGSNYQAEQMQTARVNYHGSLKPDELIERLIGGYGLVWDGNTTKTCAGSYGNYLRINNPHKVSLYLAAGLPVVLWKEAALCPFVEENGLGFGVSSLDDLDDEISAHSADYAAYVANIAKLREKVCNGGFLTEALRKLDEMIQAKER